MALALNIGSGAIALVQTGTVIQTQLASAGPITLTLPVASTAGTAMVAIAASSTPGAGASITSFPAGWIKLIAVAETTNSELEIWVYLNNPGGISAVAAVASATPGPGAIWWTHLSEWSNVLSAAALEASGSATAVGGTTLAPTTSGNVLSTGDLAISTWIQRLTAPGTVTFTTPAGFTRLVDNGSLSNSNHLDAEYKLNPATGATLGPTLTSTGTTNASASGAIVVFEKAPPVVDQTAYIQYGSLSVKLQTLDVALIDLATVPSLGDPVALTTPTWNGRVVSITKSDITRPGDTHKLVTIAATNQSAGAGGAPPGPLSDVAAGGHILLEDGSGALLLEDGSGYLLLEGTTFGYRDLSVKTSQNIDGTLTTYGSLTTFETGFVPGQTFQLTSANQGYSAQSFTITNVTISFVGAGPSGPTPEYFIEFGDAYQTMQTAGGGVLAKIGSQASIQPGTAMAAGTLGYASVTANQTTISTVVDLTGLAVTVTTVTGRRIAITGQVNVTQNTGTGSPSLAIKEGATQLAGTTTSLSAAFISSLICNVILSPTAGVHTYKLTMQTTANTCDMTASATAPAFILVEDIGT